MKTNESDLVERNENPVALNTIDAEKLLATPLPPMKYYVDGILPQGLSILAGSPKAGKSWLALWLCLQIASGKPVWERPVMKADALYLSLEDSVVRLQNRIKSLTQEAPPNLYLAVSSKALGEGLEEQLEAFLFEKKDTGIIVIDTLQKAKNGKEKQSSSYAGDYKALSDLKSLADKYGVAIVLIYHLHKSKAEDPFEQISGSAGITGAVDNSYALTWMNRSEGLAFLYMQGRDVEYNAFYLMQDGNVWEYIGEAGDQPEQDEATLADFVSRIKAVVVKGGGWKGTASELLLVTGCNSYSLNYVTKLLKASKEQLNIEGITFRYGKSNGKRYISFELAEGAEPAKREAHKVIEFPQVE